MVDENPSPTASKSGIITSENGERFIPGSVRADGSRRKEIRIRPGYKPPEDVEVYKNRTAEAWKNRGKGGVPGADAVEAASAPTQSASSNKNAKRREARKKAAAAKGEGDGEAAGDGTKEGAKKGNTPANDTAAVLSESADPEEQKAKDARKLAKKLRQARELKDKEANGDKLLPEQFAKVIKINELIRELDALGFDVNGEKKEADG
jgi:partner of Y14 and mago